LKNKEKITFLLGSIIEKTVKMSLFICLIFQMTFNLVIIKKKFNNFIAWKNNLINFFNKKMNFVYFG
jgi:hypothetical protein